MTSSRVARCLVMEVGEQAQAATRPPPSTYEVVRGQAAGLVVGSAAGAATTLVIGLGVRPLDLASSGGLALGGGVVGGLVGLVVGAIAGVVLRCLRGAPGYVAAAGAATVVALAVVALGTSTGLLHVPEGVAFWAVALAASAAAGTPWIRRGT